ncbi:MAG: protein kinase [Deltaproteobacteria bacterium]|nr:protein kinase [Deltaproteobacteria bacterium]
MKFCPTCQTQYPEDANFCPQESCATAEGPQRLQVLAVQVPARFQPIERIGGGNTGDVWRVRDAQTGVDVAYKTIAADVVATPAVFARAEREFKQLMRVSSPKIATIIECEKTPSGQLGVAMELCPGDSLERILAAGPVTFDQAKSIVSQVGQALLEAQKVGLVHRDVAPKNVLVSSAGDVKVINFPLAKPINDRVAGVAAYLSPEQVQGKPVDQRSNTYNLAAILYHMLTGEPPFQAPSVQAVLEMQVSTPVLPPSQRRPDVRLPPDVDKLLLKALDKSSSRRHLTLRLFLNDLDALKEQSAAVGKPAGEAALAKTMMFGGNQADIARMVAEARAAKAAASGVALPREAARPAGVAPGGPAAPKPAPMAPTVAAGVIPPQAAPQAQPLAVRPASPVHPATPAPQAPLAAPAAPLPPAPAAAAASSGPGPRASLAGPATPPPAQPSLSAPAAAAPAAIKPHEAGKGPPPKAGAAFRETLWFKQGDVEQLVADAKAKLQAAGKGTGDVPVLADDARPLEDRYADDGSVTVEDRKKFSLRTGGTSTALPAAGAEVPGEKMDENEMVGEISSGRRTLILIVAGVVVLALVVVIAMMVKGKGKGGSAEPGATSAGEMAGEAKGIAPPTAGAAAALPEQQARDADAPIGSPRPTLGTPPGKGPAPGLGAVRGATGAPGVGGEAKPPATAKKAPARRRPAARHGARRKR